MVGGRTGDVAIIAGKGVSLVEFERQRRVVGFLSGGRMNRDREMAEQVIDRVLLLRKADELGIDLVTDEELKARIKEMPSFQTEEKFDAKKYREFLENNLRPRGFTAQFFENVMRENIALGRVQDRLEATSDTSFRRTWNIRAVGEPTAIEWMVHEAFDLISVDKQTLKGGGITVTVISSDATNGRIESGATGKRWLVELRS